MNRIKHIWNHQFDKQDRRMAKITAVCWIGYAIMHWINLAAKTH